MKKGPGGKFRILLMAIAFGAIVFTAYGLISELGTRHEGDSYYKALISETKQRAEPPAASSGTKEVFNLTAIALSSRVESEPKPEPEPETEPEPEPVWKPYVDFGLMSEEISGIKAWIKIDGTTVDYPVVQGNDNDYYLHHLPNGESNKAGSIFLDYRVNSDFTDVNTVIFGHHLINYGMFGVLEHYKEQSFYDEHPEILIYTPEADYKAELIAGYVISGQTGTLPFSFKSDESFSEYIAYIRKNSVFKSGVTAEPGDRLLTLCTCTYNFSNARLVLVAKLTEAP